MGGRAAAAGAGEPYSGQDAGPSAMAPAPPRALTQEFRPDTARRCRFRAGEASAFKRGRPTQFGMGGGFLSREEGVAPEPGGLRGAAAAGGAGVPQRGQRREGSSSLKGIRSPFISSERGGIFTREGFLNFISV